jgi:hypothetical protein
MSRSSFGSLGSTWPTLQSPQGPSNCRLTEGRTLPDSGLCERNSNPTNRSNSPVRLMGVIIAVLLALSTAILPIAGAQAAGVMNHHGRTAAEDVQDDHLHATTLGCEDGTVAFTVADDCSSTEHTSGDGLSVSCCSMACHVFTLGVPVTLSEPTPLVRLTAIRSDQQVEGGLSARLERPPRTI